MRRGNCTTLTIKLPETVPFVADEDIVNPCSGYPINGNECGPSNLRVDCHRYARCCYNRPDEKIMCSRGPKQKCQFESVMMSWCYFPPGHCECIPAKNNGEDSSEQSSTYDTPKGTTAEHLYTSIPNHISPTIPITSPSTANSDPQKGISVAVGIGIGLGIGLLVLVIAIAVGMMIYCRRLGIQQGRKESQVPIKYNRDDEQEDYAEIDGNRYSNGISFGGALNPGYDVVNKETIRGPSHGEYTTLNKSESSTINSQYQSLKKPNQDFGSADYTDPEKYTEPPVFNTRSSQAQNADSDDDDYIGQDTSTSKNVDLQDSNDPSREYFTLEPPAASQPITDTDEQKNKDYVDVDDPRLSKSPTSKLGSDYVNVDNPSLSKSPVPKFGSDYVDVDDPSLSKKPVPKSGSDYVDVDDPSLSKKPAKKPVPKSGSDYVDVDDPSLSKTLGSKHGSDYVDVDDPSIHT
ncbi:uncharacterized protein [Amphiura filiformis]|uniref:uncharacterized protein n=1 Tax=Amphiura filiformis TaxID=82378 RepID=UPI003B227326